MIDPGATAAPGVGLVPTTVPFGWSDSTCWLLTAKPAPWSADVAFASGWPTTFGTATGFGPFETLTRTEVFHSTTAPAGGAVASTVFAGLSELISKSLYFRCACVSAAVASAAFVPTVSGTCVFGLPFETKSVTV